MSKKRKKSRKRKITRKKILNKIKRYLMRRSSPRLHMCLIVLCTAAAGFMCSFLLLSLGLNLMSVRYTLAVGFAYLTFLFLVWLWLQHQKMQLDYDIDPEDITDVADIFPVGGNGNVDFIGGGGGGGDGGGPDIGIDFDIDSLSVVLIALAAALAGIIASVFVVFSSPVLFAEVLLDSLLSYGLYKRLTNLEKGHWLKTAIKKTWLPFLIILVLFFTAGIIMRHYAPEANSIGDVWDKLMK
jgi:hypothetical protein